MNQIYKLLAIAFFLGAPFRFAWCLYQDFHHPEWWSDPLHNPYVSLSLLCVFLVLAVAVAVYVWRTEKRNRQCRCARARHPR